MTLTVWAPEGVPEVRPGDDLAALLLAAVTTDGRTLAHGDVVVVTSKVVSKAEGRVVDGADREAAIDAETVRLVARRGGTRIVRNRLGLTMAAAGVDASNVEPGRVVLLPEDPDASARALRAALAARTGLNVAVLLTDTAGRTWREGQTDLAIGAAGLVVAVDHQGDVDGYGNPLAVTLPAVADEVAGAADLVRGKLTGRPFAVARGLADLVLPPGDDGPGARSLVRADGQDLFGYGAREAVVRALAGRAGDRAAFGSPASAEEVVEALRLVHRGYWLAAVPRPDGGLDLELTGPAALRAVEAACFAFGWEVAASRSVGPDAAEARIQPATP